MSRVLVVGGGAAGMMAALTAAGNGHEVHVYEKNEKLGKKAVHHRQGAVQSDQCL